MPVGKEKLKKLLDRYYEEVLLYTSFLIRSSIENLVSSEKSASGMWKGIASYGSDFPLEFDIEKDDLDISAHVYMECPFEISWPTVADAEECAPNYETNFLDEFRVEDFLTLNDPRVTDNMMQIVQERAGEEVGRALIEHFGGVDKVDYDFYMPSLRPVLRKCVEQALNEDLE